MRYLVKTKGKVVSNQPNLDQAIADFTAELGRNDSEPVDPTVLHAVGRFVEQEGRFVWGNSRIVRMEG